MKMIQHKFVDTIPEHIENDVLYISLEYCTAIHRCACGCGQEVVTPISPTDWELFFNGKAVSLYPSIGNWSFDCQSHYWIKKGRIKWAGKWDEEEIEAGREKDRKTKETYFDERPPAIKTKDKSSADKRSKPKSRWRIFFGF